MGLLGPRWQYKFADYASHDDIHPVFHVLLADSLLVRDGAALLRVRLRDGVVTARHNLPVDSEGKVDGYTTGVAAAGRVITQGSAATVVGLDATTLADAWRFSLPTGVVKAVLAVGDSRVLAVGAAADKDSYEMYLLDAATGTLRWHQPLDHQQKDCSFFTDAARIYSTCSAPNPADRPLMARDAESGKEVWRVNSPDGRELTTNGKWLAWQDWQASCIVVADAATGVELRRLDGGSPFALDGGDLVYRAAEHQVVLDVATGHERWRTARASTDDSLAVGGAVYLVTRDGVVLVYDRASGKLLWDWNTPGRAQLVNLPDARGGQPLIILTPWGLEALSPGKHPVPIESALISGRMFIQYAGTDSGRLSLEAGRKKVPIDFYGDYKVRVTGRGTIRLEVSGVAEGYTSRHHVPTACAAMAPKDCPVLVRLTGKGHYRVDLDVEVIPQVVQDDD